MTDIRRSTVVEKFGDSLMSVMFKRCADFTLNPIKNPSSTIVNGILLPKLFWPTMRKNCSSDRENFWNSRLKAENFQKFWDQ